MMTPKEKCPFGLWKSPFSPLRLSRSLKFSDLAWAEDGSLVWLEGRGGRGVLVVQPSDGQSWRELSDVHTVRARLGYGGGDFGVGQGWVYYVENESSRLFRQPVQPGAARAVTPSFGQTAAPALSPDGKWLLYVHSDEGHDSLGLTDAEGRGWPVKLVSGADFYMQPVWHPDSKRIAWMAWNHPNMPWDGTELWVGDLTSGGKKGRPFVETAKMVAGGPEISTFQPEFSPDGRFLAYVSDETGWWHIILLDLDSGEKRQLTSGQAEHAEPAWVQGRRTFGFSPDGSRLFFLRNRAGFSSLWQLDLRSGAESQIVLDEAYTWLEQIAVAPDGGKIALIASASRIPPRIITCDLSGHTHVVRRSSAEDLPWQVYADVEPITWDSHATPVHGLYYAPSSPAYESDGLPPLLVVVHGGPTSQRTASFDQTVQFFASRGYAVLQVNYRGSTGYGRAYRNLLRGQWGAYDIEDCVSGAAYLVEQGKVDGARLVIMGGSSGGLTVLKALQDHPGFFKAGIALYAVTNLFSLAADTHKFEERYLDSMVGHLPEDADLYRERSPINFVDRLGDPLAVFQGEDDRVVPRSQSDTLVEALRRSGVPHIYQVYSGEGHGFRKPETIQDLYTKVENFLEQYVIYS